MLAHVHIRMHVAILSVPHNDVGTTTVIVVNTFYTLNCLKKALATYIRGKHKQKDETTKSTNKVTKHCIHEYYGLAKHLS